MATHPWRPHTYTSRGDWYTPYVMHLSDGRVWVLQTDYSLSNDLIFCYYCRCGEEDDNVTCTAEEENDIASDNLCGWIINNSTGPFIECLGIPGNEADEYYHECKYDACAYYDLDPMIQACNALEAFMLHCYEIGAGEILWRTDDFCPGTIFKSAICKPIPSNFLAKSSYPNHTRRLTSAFNTGISGDQRKHTCVYFGHLLFWKWTRTKYEEGEPNQH